MKKTTTFFILIIAFAIFCCLFTSCGSENVISEDAQSIFLDGIDELLNTPYLSINSTTTINDKITNYNGIIYDNMSQAKITTDDTTYYYFGGIRFMGDSDGVSIVDYITYPSLLDLMGTTLLNFSYDSSNISSIEKIDDVIFVRFIGIGTQYSFGLDLEFYGGTFSVFLDEGKITKTILSSSYISNKITYSYNNITEYGSCEKLWDSSPKVLPSENAMYANYLLTKLSEKNSTTTFHLSSNDYDTTTAVEEIVKTESLISSVFIISDDSIHTITITYTTSQIILGLGSAITEVEICYNDDYELLYMYINSGNKYYLS
jgi:hypothetical protein